MKVLLKPKISFPEIEYYLDKFHERLAENSRIYKIVKKLTDKAFPSHQDKFDKRWEYFYLPIRRSGRIIALPFSIMEYKKEFFVSFHLFGGMHIKRGGAEAEQICKSIFSEATKFAPVFKKNEKLLEKLVPYDFRTGKIRGKYLMENVLSKKQKENILNIYEKHPAKNMSVKEISLNDYLKTAAICYKAAFSAKAKKLSPFEMYKKWADGRDNEMLSIKDGNSKKEFMEWLNTKAHAGGHPFEIVFSWRRHGIHLYPPSSSSPFYRLHVTNYAYASAFVKMAIELIKEKIPFEANELKEVLDYLAGETYFTVNDYGEHNFSYYPSAEHKKKYFPHIEWGDMKTVKWKKPSLF